MKNIQIIDGAENCVYDIFSINDEEFQTLFPNGTDIAFVDEIYARPLNDPEILDQIFTKIWSQPVKKRDVCGINGTIFYDMDYKKPYYPSRIDSEAINPGGGRLR